MDKYHVINLVTENIRIVLPIVFLWRKTLVTIGIRLWRNLQKIFLRFCLIQIQNISKNICRKFQEDQQNAEDTKKLNGEPWRHLELLLQKDTHQGRSKSSSALCATQGLVYVLFSLVFSPESYYRVQLPASFKYLVSLNIDMFIFLSSWFACLYTSVHKNLILIWFVMIWILEIVLFLVTKLTNNKYSNSEY